MSSTLEYIKLRDDLLKKLLDTKDVNILKQIKDVFQNNDNDFYNDLSEEERKGITKGLQQIKRGEVSNYDDIISSHR